MWRECFKPTGWRGKWNTDYFPTLIPWAVQLLLKPWDLWLLKWSDLVRVLGAKLPVEAQESTGILEVTPIRDEALTSFGMWLNTLMKSNRRFTSIKVTTGALRWCDVMWCDVMWCDVMWCATLRSDCIRTEADFIIYSSNDSILKYYGGAHWKADSIPFFGRCIIIWLCLTRTRKYRIHEFNWLKLIMT